ncbi:hypothetical protein PSPO01_01724 [Paraphaeosphaeria sporulosa]
MCHFPSENFSYPNTSPISASHPNQPPDTWYCPVCGGLNSSWYDLCPVCGRGSRTALSQNALMPSTPYGGAGSPVTGVWYCQHCRAANSSLTPDFCPACGARR